jgi:hypothetical protein
MKKLLGLLICLGALIALTTTTTGCKKPDNKGKGDKVVTPPAKDKDATPPAKDKDVTPPAKDKDVTPPAKDKDVTPPAKDKDVTPPAKDNAGKDKDNKISISDPKDVTVKEGADATVKATVTMGADVKSAKVTAEIKGAKAKVSPETLTKSGDVTVTITGAPAGTHTLTITATGEGAAAPASTKVDVMVEKK